MGSLSLMSGSDAAEDEYDDYFSPELFTNLDYQTQTFMFANLKQVCAQVFTASDDLTRRIVYAAVLPVAVTKHFMPCASWRARITGIPTLLLAHIRMGSCRNCCALPPRPQTSI